MPAIHFAFDRKTARSRDADGRMRVKNCILSTAEVNPYRGREIPKWDKLGLKEHTVYELYRDPEELRKAVPTFEGVPLMIKHIGQTAEQPRKEYIGGSVHGVTFDGKHLRGDLLVWDGYAIDLIESDELSDLSGGYRYEADMQAGKINGQSYDGVMRKLDGNHVALVDDGRATGAHVADAAFRNPQGPDPSMQQENSMAFGENQNEPAAAPAAEPGAAPAAAPAAAAAPLDTAALGQALKHIAELLTSINARLPAAAPAAAAPTPAPAPGALDAEGGAPSGEVPATTEGGSEGSLRLTPAVPKEGSMAEDEGEGDPTLPASNQEGTPARGGPTPIGAMDAKSVNSLIDAAVRADRAARAAIDQAKRDVSGTLGAVIALDDAGEIYREALQQVGVDVSGIGKGVEKVAWDAYRTARGAALGVRQNGAQTEYAQDGKGGKDNAPAYMTHVNKISVRG